MRVSPSFFAFSACLAGTFASTAVATGLPAQLPGFLMPIGGGKESARTAFRKEVYGAAIRQLDANLARNGKSGNKVCVVEHSSMPASELQKYFSNMKIVLEESGLTAERFEGFDASSRELASSIEMASQIKKECGLVHIPGGDQTRIFELWNNTPLHKSLLSILKSGGGIMGNSAGAAVLGSVGYFPASNKPGQDIDTLAWAEGVLPAADEVKNNFFTSALPHFPRLYIETHSEQRERTARTLAVMAYAGSHMRNSQRPGGKVTGISLHSDTAVLLRWNPQLQAWTATVHGAFAAEFIFPSIFSQAGYTKESKPFYTNAETSLLLRGAETILTGSRKGLVIHKGTIFKETDYKGNAFCFMRAAKEYSGNNPQSLLQFSEVQVQAGVRTWERHPSNLPDGRQRVPLTEDFSNDDLKLDSIDMDSYATGDFHFSKGTGCGIWMPDSYTARRGQRRNRLTAQFYALGSGMTNSAVSLSSEMKAVQITSFPGLFQFAGQSKESVTTSVLVYHLKNAAWRGVSQHEYREYSPTGPVQMGTWSRGTVHLAPPGSYYSLPTGILFPALN